MQQTVREKLAAQYHSLPDFDEEEDEDDRPDDDTASTSSAGSTRPKPKRQKSYLVDLFGAGYGEPAERDELERYWLEASIPPNEDPLQWCCAKRRQFPKLYRLASRYLCAPATSVPAERVFSAAGLIVNRLRSRLSPEHVDMLISLNKNLSAE